MYRHLLVPVDDTALSAANVATASQLASRLGSRITFVHATPEFAVAGDEAVLLSIEPVQFQIGDSDARHSILSKAMVAAQGAGVECDGISVPSDHPAEAIVHAAIERRCDLIVMASRGARGVAAWLQRSQTRQVLKQSPVALLVTRVEANEPLSASERALGVIQDEHRSMAVVMRAMRQLARLAESGTLTEVDLIGLRAMVGYVREFPIQLHHPKEEQYLHPMLRQRHPPCEALLVEVEAQHRREPELVSAVDDAVAAMYELDTGAGRHLAATLDQLAEAVLAHIGLEERTVLPLARRHLLDTDWQTAADAFAGNMDPEFSELASQDLRRLFARIAGIATASVRAATADAGAALPKAVTAPASSA